MELHIMLLEYHLWSKTFLSEGVSETGFSSSTELLSIKQRPSEEYMGLTTNSHHFRFLLPYCQTLEWNAQSRLIVVESISETKSLRFVRTAQLSNRSVSYFDIVFQGCKVVDLNWLLIVIVFDKMRIITTMLSLISNVECSSMSIETI